MLKQIKKITSGIDVKANPYMTLVDALLNLLNMRQQSSESNDHYVERFNANVQTLNLAKGGHIFCSRALVQCEDDDDITETEKYNEEQKLKAAILL